MEQLASWWAYLQEHPHARVMLSVPVSILFAAAVNLTLGRLISAIVGRTRSQLDDKLWPLLRRPITVSLVIIGVGLTLADVPMNEELLQFARSLLATMAVLYWVMTGVRVIRALLDHALTTEPSHARGRGGFIQRRTVPAVQIAANTMLVGAGLYFLLVAWGINVSAWVASAGIAGIAVGFAAQDTLANLFAGITILADAPYELGDFVALESGEEGVVSRITFRSTRITTREDIEIIVPNSVMAKSRLRNLTGGSATPSRCDIPVGVAYGSDLARVEALLVAVGAELDHVLQTKARSPDVRFVGFGASSLDHVLRVWLVDPGRRVDVVHAANRAIYAAFADAGIEIPYAKHDVYLHQASAPVDAAPTDG